MCTIFSEGGSALTEESMKKEEWKEKIINDCKSIGTYRKEYDSVIETLSSLLEARDTAYNEFIEDYQGKIIYEYPNKAIGTNPALNAVDLLNKSALSYWRDLGLTPAGNKKITNTSIKPRKKGLSLSETVSLYERELDMELSNPGNL